MATILDKIFESKRLRVGSAKAAADLEQLARQAKKIRAAKEPHRLSTILSNRTSINIIAEFKRASPSKGVINPTADPAELAWQYQAAGACSISVLTEEDHFQGSLDDLRKVHDAVSIPVLRKDFIFNDFQIYESAAAGADAILLIAAMLSDDDLRRLQSLAADELGLDALVEVHTAEEMERAASVGSTLIGVNNRDLHTFAVSLDVSRNLIGERPEGSILVAESGLRSSSEVLELHQLGFSGFLIGETLMRSDDPANELTGLITAGAGQSTI